MHSMNLINLGWLFFTAWTIAITVLSAKAFGPELLHELRGRKSNVK